MKTAIIYASKHGATAQIAQKLAAQLGGAELFNVHKGEKPDIGAYDTLVLGSWLMAGMADKALKEFASQNEAAIMQKRVAVFISGLTPQPQQEWFTGNFPEGMLAAAVAKGYLQGAYNPATLGFLEKGIMRLITKSAAPLNYIDDEAIAAFAAQVKGE